MVCIHSLNPKHKSNFRPIARNTGILMPLSVDEWLTDRRLFQPQARVAKPTPWRGSHIREAEAARHPRRRYVPESDPGDRGRFGVIDQRHYLRDKFHRPKVRTSIEKAAVTIAHKILIAVFHMLQRGVGFADIAGGSLDQVDKHSTAKSLAHCFTALGYDVMLCPKATACMTS